MRMYTIIVFSMCTVGITSSLPCPRDGNGDYWMFSRARTRKCVKDTRTRIHGLSPQFTGTTWHGIHPSESQCKVVMFFACILSLVCTLVFKVTLSALYSSKCTHSNGTIDVAITIINGIHGFGATPTGRGCGLSSGHPKKFVSYFRTYG